MQFENIPPATQLVWDAGGVRNERYWRIDFSRRRPLAWNDALIEYDDIMTRSVRGNLVADVPVGVMLSGGVDSSTVAALAAKQGGQVHTYCIGHDAPGRPDIEFERAQRAATILGTSHRNVQFDEPLLADMPRVIARYDQPISSLVALYADRLAEVMRRQVKVALSGNGADEVFGGYQAYSQLSWRDHLHRLLRPLPVGVAEIFPARWRERARQEVESAKISLARRRGAGLSIVADGLLERLCTPAFAETWRGADAGRFVSAASAECNPDSLSDAAMYSDLMVYHQHGHGVIADVSGMTYGLEIRAPFLDHRVIEFAASLPSEMLIAPLRPTPSNKRIIKRRLERSLPKDLVHARKVGFGYNIRLDQQFRGAWAPAIERRLLEGRYLDLGIFSREGARWALANSFRATTILLTFSIWADMALGGQSPADVAAGLAPGDATAHAPSLGA